MARVKTTLAIALFTASTLVTVGALDAVGAGAQGTEIPGGDTTTTTPPPTVTQPAAAPKNPIAGDGMWIWELPKTERGKIGSIAKRAKKRGIETVFIKAGDGAHAWSQFTPGVISALKAKGLNVCGWQYVYGSNPKGEAKIGALAKSKGADCLIIDAETEYEGRYAKASSYMAALRSRVGASFPIGLSSFPYTDYHPAFPYSVFLGPGGAQYNLPQVYWKAIGTTVDAAFTHSFVFNRAYKRPQLPTGQVYEAPKPKQIRRFRSLARANHLTGVSWWSWQHAGKRQFKAVGGKVKGIRGYKPYDSYPLLRNGSKGDLVAWAQQLMTGGGYSTAITGYFTSATKSAVVRLQAAKGLAQTGNIDIPTWRVLMTFNATPVRWTKKGAVRTSSADGVQTLSEPLSAGLGAKHYELPRQTPHSARH